MVHNMCESIKKTGNHLCFEKPNSHSMMLVVVANSKLENIPLESLKD
jgi:hypothetical protein